MQSLSELIDETPPDRLRDNASPDAQRMRASATTEEAPPTAPPRRIAPSTQDALEAAEHGDARALAAYLENGGDPAATSRLHHMGWSLLHLAAGCALAGGPGAAQAYRRRPEPDAPGGFARCVELLLAAGAEPAPGDERPAPLAGAVLCGDAASARLLLRAGAAAPTEVEAPPGRHTAAEREAMRELLAAPPKLLPRSPLRVEAKLSEYVEGDARERVVEVRWRPPPPAPGVGPVERYVVRGRAVAGGSTSADAAVEFAVGAARAPGAGRRPPRRDFCANEAVDRGVALRRHLNLPPPPCPSTLVHGLAPATTYRFAVSCVCAVDGELRESPPSLRSRPLEVPAVPACVEIKFQAPRAVGAMLSLSLHLHDGVDFPRHRHGVAHVNASARGRGNLAHWLLSTQVDEENWQTGELLEKVLTHGLGTRAAAAAAPRPAARDDASGAAYAALDAGRPPPAPLLRPVAGPKEECVIV